MELFKAKIITFIVKGHGKPKYWDHDIHIMCQGKCNSTSTSWLTKLKKLCMIGIPTSAWKRIGKPSVQFIEDTIIHWVGGKKNGNKYKYNNNKQFFIGAMCQV